MKTRLLISVDARTVAIIFVTLLATFALFGFVADTVTTLTRVVIGIVLALALDGLVHRLRDRFGLSRPVAVSIVAFGLFALVTVVVLVLGPPAIREARDFAKNLPKTVRELYTLPIIGSRLEGANAVARVQGWVHDLPTRVSTDNIANLAESVVGGVATAVIVLVTTFAVLIDGERLVQLFRSALPERVRGTADRAGRVFYQVVGRYFGGSVTVAVLMGLYVLALTLLFGVPLAPLAAVWAMITDLIPQVGGLLGGVLLALLAFAAGPVTAIIVVGLYALYMNAENHFIQPAIVGSAVHLTPPTTMLAAIIGGAAAGVPGALIATPLVGATKQLYFEFHGGEPLEAKKQSKRRSPIAAIRRRLAALIGRGRSSSS